VLITDHTDARDVKLIHDGGEFVSFSPPEERDELEHLGLATQDVEGLGSDRSGGAEERDAAPHCRIVSPV